MKKSNITFFVGGGLLLFLTLLGLSRFSVIADTDTTPPSSTVNLPQDSYGPLSFNASSTIAGTASDSGSGVSSLHILLQRDHDGGSPYWNGGAWTTDATELNTNITTGTGSIITWQFDAAGLQSAGLANGTLYAVTPIATDLAANTATGSSDNFVWDSVAPTVQIGVPGAGSTTGLFTVMKVVTNENSNCQYQVDAAGSWTTFSDTGGTSHSHTATFTTGSHSIQINCTDTAQNIGTASSAWTVSASASSSSHTSRALWDAPPPSDNTNLNTNAINMNASKLPSVTAGNSNLNTALAIPTGTTILDGATAEEDSQEGGQSVWFSDVEQHWSRDYVERLKPVCNLQGYHTGSGSLLPSFQPDKPMDRAELVTLIVKCQGLTLPTETEQPFLDVDADHWAGPAIVYAQSNGILAGLEGPYFYPHQSLSRAEALRILLLGWFDQEEIQMSTPAEFSDVSETKWYAPFVSFAFSQSLISGYLDTDGVPNGLFGPENTITRAEVSKILVKILGL